ncbi:pilus assembly protein CpaF [Cohnella sp. SGD-V74]|uniref:ATPase, T2SS/T4P/T4SS family n=1 Tax=unclassified Cohnella TaxID=2636738 RepID=UPI000B8C1718|nr:MULTISPECIES: ATPase, T2SS/T4P/T4SS family [unclassified Cohnella]PRX65191.1 pilus assembly protein CpaF [Cohnella sp. SGD-V74]
MSEPTMRIRKKFHLTSYIKDLKHLNSLDNKPEKLIPIAKRRVRTKMSLSEASEIIYKHLMDRSKNDTQLHEDIMSAGLGEPNAQERLKAVVENLILEYKIDIDESTLIDNLSPAESVFAETCGASLLDDLLRLPDVEEVQAIGQDIFLIRNAEQTMHHRKFSSLKHVELLQDRLALCGKKPINDANPFLQTYLWSGSRLVMSRPRYSDVPAIHIRNFLVKDVSLDLLATSQFRTINTQMAGLQKKLIKFKSSFLIGGGTNTGKTTYLYGLCEAMSEQDRIRTLEKEFEISLRRRLSGKRNILAVREVEELGLTMEEAFKPLLVMSPTWIIEGEAKGSEINQAIQGSLRGHNVIVTVHTNNRDSITSDIYDMIKQDNRNHDVADIMNRIARAFPILVYKRIIKIKNVNYRVATEITHLYVEDGKVYVKPLVLWDYEKLDWVTTGNKFHQSFKERLIGNGATAADFAEFGVW